MNILRIVDHGEAMSKLIARPYKPGRRKIQNQVARGRVVVGTMLIVTPTTRPLFV
jgi:hypothetical protein